MGRSHSLPPEVLEQIFLYISSDQSALYGCTFISRSWYTASVPFLYHHPYLTGKNFDLFVRAVCPSINSHIRHNGLSVLVRKLDMCRLVHNGQKSLTARLLGRVKENLEEFTAPQASFACVIAHRLRSSCLVESSTDLAASQHQLPCCSFQMQAPSIP